MAERTRDEKLPLEVRVPAARRRTSPDERSREERLRLAAWDQVRALVERPKAVIGGALPSRDEVHER